MKKESMINHKFDIWPKVSNKKGNSRLKLKIAEIFFFLNSIFHVKISTNLTIIFEL